MAFLRLNGSKGGVVFPQSGEMLTVDVHKILLGAVRNENNR